MSAKHNAVTRLHNGHGHAVIGNVDRVFVGGVVRSAHALPHEIVLAHVVLIHPSVALLKLYVRAWHASLIECLAKVLLEICNRIK